MPDPKPSRIDAFIDALRRRFRKKPEPMEPGSPEDPYAYVGAPKKPKPPTRSAAAAVEPER